MSPDDRQALREWQDELMRRIMAAAHAARERVRDAHLAGNPINPERLRELAALL